MAISSYQVEWLIHQRRRWRGLLRMVERALLSGGDRVQMSEEADQRTAQQAPKPRRKAPETEIWPVDLADSTVYPPAVAYELERRAGSFMQPKYPHDPPPAGIPRLKPKEPGQE
ncbi:MAG: hypothetical protein O7C61_09400 [SAR324 cluster bacterium]|nr:hypothetical protein [SAR324 cluster bacterium]